MQNYQKSNNNRSREVSFPFFGSVEMLNYKLNAYGGFTPAAVAPPKYDKPRTGTTSLSLFAGAEWGDRYCPLFHRTSALYFIS
jgi:hypothetical protein